MPVRNLVFIGLATLISLSCYSIAVKNRYASIFSTALQIVHDEALVQKSERELFNAAMTGMMSQLDPNSGFVSHDRFKAFDEDINQEFVGVGMEVERDENQDGILVVSPIPNSPAYKAGLQVGDLIVSIDGTSTAGLARPDAINLIRGPKGEDVVFSVHRRGVDDHLTIVVTRDSIPIPSVYGDTRNTDGTWNFVLQGDRRIGYIRLTQFGKRSTEEMQTALESIKDNIDAFILDLRMNPGGLLDSAIDISDMFIGREVVIVQTKRRDGEFINPRYATSKTVLPTKIPMVVIVNEYSASGSEIVAACLQDHNRATIVGKQSYGKGTVQDLITLEQNRSVLRLTTASYWRPSKKNIDRTIPLPDGSNETEYGVKPDAGQEVDLTDQQLIDITTARNLRDQKMFEANGVGKMPGQDGPDHNAGEMDWLEIDLPLKKAVEYLHSRINVRAAA